jgi:hypothetical protein
MSTVLVDWCERVQFSHVWSLEELVRPLDPENGRKGGMKHRIIMWAVAGCLVAGFWVLYFFPTVPISTATRGLGWILARLTCPVAFASFYFHFPVSIYWAILANAATYALVGLTVETLRRRPKHAS